MSSNKPFPSSDLDVFKDNSIILDNFVNSQDNEYPDRFNRKRPTITGIIKEAFSVRTDISNMNETLIGQSRWDVVPKNTSLSLGGDNGALNKQAQALFNRTEMLKVHAKEALRRTYQEVGLNLVEGSFEQGGTLQSITDVLLEEKTGKVYSWNGSFPKVISKGTLPTSEIEFVYRGDDVNPLFTQGIYSSLRSNSISISVVDAKLKNEVLYLGTGQYASETEIDASGMGGIIGNGINASVINSPVLFTNPSDVYGSGAAFVLSKLSINVNESLRAMSIGFSHYYSVESVSVVNLKDTGTALYMTNAWLGNFKNCYFQGDLYGVFIKGSSHAVKFERCRFYSGANGDAFHIENTTIANDGNLSVMLDTCDVEFCDGNGVRNSGAQKLTIVNPYHESVKGYNIINTNDASTTIDGGAIGVGKQKAVIKIDSGHVLVKNCRLYSESAGASLQKLVESTGGSVGFFDVEIAISSLGNMIFEGGLIKGPSKQSVCRRSVNMWQPSHMSQEYVLQGVNKYIASSSGFCEVYCFNDRDNFIFPPTQLFNVYIKYSSNADFSLRSQTSAGGGAPLSPNVLLPSTAGKTVTMVIPNVNGVVYSNAVQTSIYRDGGSSGDYITLHDIGIFSNDAHPIDRQIWFPS